MPSNYVQPPVDRYCDLLDEIWAKPAGHPSRNYDSPQLAEIRTIYRTLTTDERAAITRYVLANDARWEAIRKAHRDDPNL